MSTTRLQQQTIGFAAPGLMVEVVDNIAEKLGTTRSIVLRELVTTALAQRGEWPPASPSRGK